MNTLHIALEAAAAILVLGGALFSVIGGIGLLRMPDFYSRCHGAGITDSAGAGGILVGLLFVSDLVVAIKLVTVLVFLWLSSVASTHALVKAAYARGVRVDKPRVKDWTSVPAGVALATPSPNEVNSLGGPPRPRSLRERPNPSERGPVSSANRVEPATQTTSDDEEVDA